MKILPLKDVERRAILQTLKRFNGNRMRAAKALEISVTGLRGKIRAYRREGLEIPASVFNEKGRKRGKRKAK